MSLVLKGHTDGLTIKGGDATSGEQTTMYDGPRPDPSIAGTCGWASVGTAIELEACVDGDVTQTWALQSDGQSIVSEGQCIDIDSYATTQGSTVWAYPCGKGSKENEFWPVQDDGTIASLQPDTPFCVGVQGATTVLDDCDAASSAFTIGSGFGQGGDTIVQKTTGLCLTRKPSEHPGAGYQPMRKQGAIILATGGDESNSAQGNFYEGFMATGYATDETNAAIQANIVAVGYSGFQLRLPVPAVKRGPPSASMWSCV